MCRFACVFLACVSAYAAQETPLPPEFKPAMDRGVAFLKSLQKPDGSWPHQRPGATPLAAWTLLECDVSPNDPAIQKAVAWTRGFILTSDRTYEIALAIMPTCRSSKPLRYSCWPARTPIMAGATIAHPCRKAN
jgi:hypothetical protein